MQDWMSKLERAKALLDAGALTQQEFDAEKARLLPKSSYTPPVGPSEPEEPLIDQSHLMHEEDHDIWNYSGPVRNRLLTASLIAAAIAAGAYLLIPAPNSNSPLAPSPNQNAQSEVSKPAQKLPRIEKQIPAPVDDRFGCEGAYSAVSFSEESGDGSGLFVRIDPSGNIKNWLYYEGGVLHGNVLVESKSSSKIIAMVSYPEFPDSTPSKVVLLCKDDTITVKSDHIDERDRLKKLSEKEAAELDQ